MFFVRVLFKLTCSSEFGGSNSRKDLLIFLRAQQTATQQSNKPFYRLFAVFVDELMVVRVVWGVFLVCFVCGFWQFG